MKSQVPTAQNEITPSPQKRPFEYKWIIVGGAIAIQVLSPIIEAGGRQYRNAYFISGMAVLVVGVIILLFMREAPRQPAATTAGAVKKRWAYLFLLM